MAAVDAEKPDVVLTDIRMPPTGTDEGIRAATELRQTYPAMGVVVLSQYAEPAYALALLEGGSEGRAYLLKERVSEPVQLLGAIPDVASGGSVVDPKVVEALVAPGARKKESPARTAHATGAGGPVRDRPGQEQRSRRVVAGPVGTGRREAHQLAVLQARV